MSVTETKFMTKSKLPPYSIIEVPIFDARSSLKRCSLPGVGASVDGHPKANADFWWSPEGSVMLKTRLLTSQYAFEARLATGLPIPERSLSDFGWYVSDQLLRWATNIDDVPFEEDSFPLKVIAPTDSYWLARLFVYWMELDISNRDPEIIRELFPKLGSIKTIGTIADAPNFNACFCLLIDQIVDARSKAKRLQKTAKTEIIRKAMSSVEKSLSALHDQLMTFLADSGTTHSPIKALEMSERESIMWDNDPFALSAITANDERVNKLV